MIFYGDESNITGMKESDYRQKMIFEQNQTTADIIRSLSELRSKFTSLQNGNFQLITHSDSRCLCFRRDNEHESILIMIHQGNTEIEIPNEILNNSEILLDHNRIHSKLGVGGYLILKETKL